MGTQLDHLVVQASGLGFKIGSSLFDLGCDRGELLKVGDGVVTLDADAGEQLVVAVERASTLVSFGGQSGQACIDGCEPIATVLGDGDGQLLLSFAHAFIAVSASPI